MSARFKRPEVGAWVDPRDGKAYWRTETHRITGPYATLGEAREAMGRYLQRRAQDVHGGKKGWHRP